MASDLPPAYDLLQKPVKTDVAIEHVPSCDVGSELLVNNSFEDKTTRIAFIQKVLAIHLLQLLLIIIAMLVFAAMDWDVERAFRRNGTQIMVLTTLAFLATSGLLMYCTEARRENPYRYVFLVAHPISFAVFICFPIVYCQFLGSLAVALGTYVSAMFAVLLYSVFALQTKLEFAAKHAIFLAGVVQILMYAVTVPVTYVDAFGVLYVAFALCLNYIYVFWDMELMTSKKYWHHVTPEGFVDGALNLHVDYYYMFINIVMPQINKCTEMTIGPENH